MKEIVSLLKEIVALLRSNVNDRRAYSVPEFAVRVGLSTDQIHRHIERGDLTAKYSGSKKLIPVSEADAFIDRLDDEDLGGLR